MLIGAHLVVYSTDAEADRTFFRDVLELKHVDAGRGWLIFALPPTEMAFHPTEQETPQELYLLTADLEDAVARLRKRGVSPAPITDAPWGTVTSFTLPGGGRIGLYQPKHPLAISPAEGR